MKCTSSKWLGLAMVAVLAIGASSGGAAERKARPKAGDFNPAHESVELFAAVDAGQIEVRVIPRDSTRARVLIENKTDQPLNVQLPEAFAIQPVLAQFGGQGGGQQGGGGGGQQSGGGGFGGGGGQQGGGGGFFNVAPEKVGQIRVEIVCLEHGKADPRPAVPYELKPISAFTSDTKVHELCKLLGQGEYSQRAAQVAAWHLADGMSFDELASKEIRRLNGEHYPYFNREEMLAGIQMSQQAAREAAAAAEASTAQASPGAQAGASEQASTEQATEE